MTQVVSRDLNDPCLVYKLLTYLRKYPLERQGNMDRGGTRIQPLCVGIPSDILWK